jgi:outer membrane protein assembly factor BamE (lipoprotein component of BamABCDE complex)
MSRAALTPLLAVLVATACSAILTPAATTYPITAEVKFAELAGMKRGEACAKTILYLFGPSGQASVAAAALAGGLHKVRYVDNRYDNNVFRQRYCVIAYGE